MHWKQSHRERANELLTHIRLHPDPPFGLYLPASAWRMIDDESGATTLAPIFVQRIAAQVRERQRPVGWMATVQSYVHLARARAGQRLLRSSFHTAYRRLRNLLPPQHDPSFLAYQRWLLREAALIPSREILREQALRLPRQPTITILMPLHHPRLEWLNDALTSILSQTYTNWQLCIYDDASCDTRLTSHLAGLADHDPRVHLAMSDRQVGISEALNRAANLATGEYVAAVDQDDVLPYWSLQCVVQGLQQPETDVLYTDEDFIDEGGLRRAPHFKPAWSPTLLDGAMYLGHLVVVRRTLFEQVGRYRARYDGAQDYDLALRVTERARSVVHVPMVAYHWRMHAHSVAANPTNKKYTHAAGLDALRNAVERRKWTDATVSDGNVPNLFFVERAAPTNHEADIVVIGDSTSQAGDLNRAAYQCARPFVVFVRAELAPTESAWSRRLLGRLANPQVGIVGACLTKPNGSIYEAGVTLGTNGDLGRPGQGTFGSTSWLWLNAAREVTAIDSGCFAVRRDLFEAIRGFDPSMPAPYQMVDFCLRARERGYSVLIESRATLRVPDSYHPELPSADEWQVFIRRWAEHISKPDPYFSQNVGLDGGCISL